MKKILIVLMMSALLAPLFADAVQQQIARVYITDNSQIIRLLRMDIDIARLEKGEYVEIVTTPEQVLKLQSAGFQVEILIENWDQHYAEIINPNQDDMGGFFTYDEMIDRLNLLHQQYPDFITEPFSIGQSHEGRELWMIKVSDNPDIDEDEPEVLYDGLHHAREPIGMQLLIYFVEYLMQNYGIIPDVTEAVDERELFFLPCVNPDGYYYNEQTNPNGGGMWRKNRRDNGSSYGVDLNRNYPYYWGYDNQGSSGSSSSSTYRGPSPGSEPEVQAIMEFINSRHIALSHSYHSYGNMILYPWGGDYLGYTPDHADFTMMAAQMQSYNGYDPGTPWELLYNVNGGSFDWHYGEQTEHYKIMAFSLEVGPSFWPTPSIIPQLCAENVPVNLYSALVAENYTPPEVYLTIAGMDIDDSSGNNNGTADPGEYVLIDITLMNTGTSVATDVDAILQCDDTYITINSAQSVYPDIVSLNNSVNSTPFTLAVSSTCPAIYEAEMRLIVSHSTTMIDTLDLILNVGDPMNLPTGPDEYGYMAYDQLDGHEYGDYDWIELDPAYGGSGANPVNFTSDDQTLYENLPFTFSYYGEDYTQISINSNGWAALGYTESTDYSNSHIPDNDGPPAMLAPFWEDLSPQNVGAVLTHYDENNNWYVIEFSRVGQFNPPTALETFELILFDPAEYQTITGDGLIKFQYHTVTDPSSTTAGIEDPSEMIGLEIWYNGSNHINSHPIENEAAIIFTTGTEAPELSVTLTPLNPPIIILAGGGMFQYDIAINNTGTSPVMFDAWIDALLPTSVLFEILNRPEITLAPGGSISRPMSQNVPANAPAGNYTYSLHTGNHPSIIFAEDSFPFTKTGADLNAGSGNWDIYGWDNPLPTVDLPLTYSLSQNYPNPFNPETSIEFTLPEAAKVTLTIFNIAGQEVEKLVDRQMIAGVHNAVWNADALPSGVYFYRLDTPGFKSVKKCVLIK